MSAPSHPSGLNHLVINVRNMEQTHRFWTEMLGFQQVGEFGAGDPSGLRRTMRFYSADYGGGKLSHHDIAFCEVPSLPAPDADGKLVSAIGHIAIGFADRVAWLRQLAYLQACGVRFERRVEHGMTHSVYIRDPNGYSVELLYELPRELWEGDINAALNHYVTFADRGARSTGGPDGGSAGVCESLVTVGELVGGGGARNEKRTIGHWLMTDRYEVLIRPLRHGAPPVVATRAGRPP